MKLLYACGLKVNGRLGCLSISTTRHSKHGVLVVLWRLSPILVWQFRAQIFLVTMGRDLPYPLRAIFTSIRVPWQVYIALLRIRTFHGRSRPRLLAVLRLRQMFPMRNTLPVVDVEGKAVWLDWLHIVLILILLLERQ